MEISELYEMQKVLDARIIAEKGLEGQNLLPNTVLALQVEIGEMANEWRGFKHWSNDREPRTNVSSLLPSGSRNPLLEEYADCLHFLLSIAHQLGLSDDQLNAYDTGLKGDTTYVFTELLQLVGNVSIKQKHEQKVFSLRGAFHVLVNLGQQRFGFTWEQICEAYVAKNKVNHERQANGY